MKLNLILNVNNAKSANVDIKFEGGFKMLFIKKHIYDLILVLVTILMISSLAWEWSNVKSFISGGVIAVCLSLRAMRALKS